VIRSTLLPGAVTWLDALRVVLATLIGAAALRWLARQLVPPMGPTRPDRVLVGLAGVLLLTLLAGWLTVTHEPLLVVIGPDGLRYQELANLLRADLPRITRPPILTDRTLYLLLVAGAQWVFGAHAYVTVVLNATFAGASYLLVVATTRELTGDPGRRERTGELAALVYIAVPIVHVWMGSPLREALTLVLLMTGVYAAVRFARGGSALWLAGSAGAAAGLIEVRPFYIPTLLVGTVTAGLLRLLARPDQRRRWASRRNLLGASALTLVLTLWWAPELSRLARWGLIRARSHHRALGDGGTALPHLEVDAGWGQAIGELPVAFLRYLVGPLEPAMLRARPPFLLEVPVWLALLLPLAVGLYVLLVRAATRQPAAWVPVSVAAATALLGAVTLGNYGIISRIRLTTWLPLLPIVAIGLDSGLLAVARWRAHRHRRPDTPRAGTGRGTAQVERRAR
jgi:hypothetical protein